MVFRTPVSFLPTRPCRVHKPKNHPVSPERRQQNPPDHLLPRLSAQPKRMDQMDCLGAQKTRSSKELAPLYPLTYPCTLSGPAVRRRGPPHIASPSFIPRPILGHQAKPPKSPRLPTLPFLGRCSRVGTAAWADAARGGMASPGPSARFRAVPSLTPKRLDLDAADEDSTAPSLWPVRRDVRSRTEAALWLGIASSGSRWGRWGGHNLRRIGNRKRRWRGNAMEMGRLGKGFFVDRRAISF